MDDLIQKLIDLNITMIKNGEVNNEYADSIIEIKNEYERRLEEYEYLKRMNS